MEHKFKHLIQKFNIWSYQLETRLIYIVELIWVVTTRLSHSIGTFSFTHILSFILKVGKEAAALISAGTELYILGARPKKLF